MTKRITIEDVANQAGVSKSTVSQYLNERFDYMGEKTRMKIEKVIKELDYQPNVIARSLKKKSTSTIGVIVANILHAYSTQVIRAIENVCNENGISTIICNADDDSEKEKNYLETLLSKQIDGLIVIPTSGNLEMYNKLISENFPLVFLDRIVDGLDSDTILLDNKKASELAVDCLYENGHEKIAIVTTSLIDNVTPRVERIQGYKEALKKRHIQINQEYIKGAELSLIKQKLTELFTLSEPPTAIISGNDLTLMEILSYTFDNGIKIGKDIGLITVDEVSFAAIHTPPLTTIVQPTIDMGTKAAEILLEKINNKQTKNKPTIYRYDPSLIVRGSVERVGDRID